MSDNGHHALVDLIICAAAQAWREDGEVLATGIGVVPRLAASFAMRTVNPELMMTDSEAWLVSEPVPIGPRNGYRPRVETWMGFDERRRIEMQTEVVRILLDEIGVLPWSEP